MLGEAIILLLFILTICIVYFRRQRWVSSFTMQGEISNEPSQTPFSFDSQWIVSWDSVKPVVRIISLRNGEVIHELIGEPHSVRAAFASPYGQQIAEYGDGGICRIWSARTGELERELQAPNTNFEWGCFLPNGKSMLTLGGYFVGHPDNSSRGLHLWDIKSGKSLWFREYPLTPYLPNFSSSGDRFLFMGSDGAIQVCDSSNGKTLRRIRDPNTPRGHWYPHFVPGTLEQVAALDSHGLVIYSCKGGDKTHFASDAFIKVFDYCFSPDGRYVVKTGFNRPISHLELWDTKSGHLIYSQEFEARINTVLYSKSGAEILATGGISMSFDGSHPGVQDMFFVEALSGHVLGHLKVPGKRNIHAQVSPDGRYIAIQRWGDFQVWFLRYPFGAFGHFYRLEVWGAAFFGLLLLWRGFIRVHRKLNWK